MKPIGVAPVVVEKKWGGELIVCNNAEFCGKFLTIRRGCKFSMHFHRDKREVFYLLSGKLALRFIETETARTFEIQMFRGDTMEIPRLLPHQLEALEDSEVVEFSTHHEDSDSYRVAPGDSQK